MKNRNNTRIFLFAASIFGLIMMESPLLLAANRVEPFIFGFPFLVAWILFWWAFCTILFFIAHKMNWGKPKSKQESDAS
ncbi:DUF3311 domain-containing protein [Alteribacillus iranensis]|uniref:DUF3311 domain-containing protein n=1 Tax=Alteribacillus iranensis TaxID=930128 RepID=A0A1I2BQY4_9BACI|nr:DUF3311 domain-containing protein [Alteribacillus iranensis]SFE58541.1 Protein of unknown function [Alteribacillus iranensis]